MGSNGPNFGIVPSRVIFDTRLTSTEKVVLMALASYANRDRVCVVKQSTLATRLEVSRQSVNDCTVNLVACGYLAVIHRGAVGKRGRGANGYKLLFESGICVNSGRLKSSFETTTVDTNTVDLRQPDLSQIHSDDLCRKKPTALTGSVNSLDLSVSGFPYRAEEKEQDRFAHARATESLSPLVEKLTPQTERGDLWRQVKRILAADGTATGAKAVWLDNCTLHAPEPQTYLLRTATSFQRDMVRNRYAESVRLEVQRITKQPATLTVECSIAHRQKQRSASA